jgi:hypothetical protein
MCLWFNHLLDSFKIAMSSAWGVLSQSMPGRCSSNQVSSRNASKLLNRLLGNAANPQKDVGHIHDPGVL